MGSSSVRAAGSWIPIHQPAAPTGNTDADEAFDLLRRESQATNTRLHTVATELVTRLSTPATDDLPTTEISPDCSQ
jgi:hypothetical protein